MPPDTPITVAGGEPIPTAGPYYYASFARGRRVVLRRNPNYGGTRPARFREIEVALDVGEAATAAAVLAGRADYAMVVPPSRLAALERRFGAHSAAARTGRQRYFHGSLPVLHYFLVQQAPGDLRTSIRAPRGECRPGVRRAGRRGCPPGGLVAGVPGRPTDQLVGSGPARLPRRGRPSARRGRSRPGRPARPRPPPPAGGPLYLRQPALPAGGSRGAARPRHHRYRPRGQGLRVVRRCSNGSPDGASHGTSATPPGSRTTPTGRTAIAAMFALRANPSPAPSATRRSSAASGPPCRLPDAARARAIAALDADLVPRRCGHSLRHQRGTTDFFADRIGCQVHQPIYGISLGALCVRR